MKRCFLFSFLFVLLPLSSSADDSTMAAINLQHKNQYDHFDLPVPADMPEVYYSPVNQEIIIDGDGVVNYYDVEICSATSWNVVVSTQVNGSYDTIDISSLPTGEYYITIDSPTGNTYEGFFDTY